MQQLANLNSDYFSDVSDLFLDLISLLKLNIEEINSDFLFLKNILEDSFEYLILFSK